MAGFNGVPSSRVVGAVHVRVTLELAVTVSAEVPETVPDVALIVVEPAATVVARPLEPAALLIDATPVLEELQVTDAVRFCVVLSEKVPVASDNLRAPDVIAQEIVEDLEAALEQFGEIVADLGKQKRKKAQCKAGRPMPGKKNPRA